MVVSAALSSSDPRTSSEIMRSRSWKQHARRCVSAKTKRGSRQRCQRSRRSERRGSNRPTFVARIREDDGTEIRVRSVEAEAVSGVVKTPGPSVMPRDNLGLSRGVPDRESGSSEPGTDGERVHVIRSGGRSRLDASRVFRAGRSQGLVEREGASLEEARSAA